MSLINIVGAVAIILLQSCIASVVIDLHAGNFDETLINHDYVAILYFSPECRRCMEFLPDYEAAGVLLANGEPKVQLATLNCLNNGAKLCGVNGIVRYPTLRIYDEGNSMQKDYDGEWKVDELVRFMRENVGIQSTWLQGINDTIFDKDKDVVVAYLSWKSTLRSAYFALPAKLRIDLNFYHVDVKPYQENVTLVRCKLYSSQFEPRTLIRYPGQPDLEEFLLTNRYGLVGHRTMANYHSFNAPLATLYLQLNYRYNRTAIKYYRNRILPIAVQFHKAITFCMCSLREFEFELNSYAIDMQPEPFLLIRLADGRRYAMQESFTSSNIKRFVSNALTDDYPRQIMSQPVPKAPNVVEVWRSVVALNFDEVILGANHDLLIMFYNEPCAYCDDLEPMIRKLKAMLADDNIHFYQMNLSRNEITTTNQFHITVYPSIFFVPRYEKSSPVEFRGRETYEKLVRFIAAHSTFGLRQFDRLGNLKRDEF